MSRRFTLVTVCLSATVAFLVGLIVAGSLEPARVTGAPGTRSASPAGRGRASLAGAPLNFADIVERLNPAVVNIEATSKGRGRARRGAVPVDPPDDLDGEPRRDRGGPSRGSGTGFVIDADGSILTNFHVIEEADRISVKLADGRSVLARVVGTDPDTDIALIKVTPPGPLTVASLGDSDRLRVGEWVCAIGNPLAYEHSVTVGVVSYIGRKLFDTSLDHYIQTDAAINFGNSGGPLINADGEVIGINAAISSRASNIGFAVPINTATSILAQLRSEGRVSRGYMGVALKDVDPDLQHALHLSSARGAVVQDIVEGSPGERAGLRTYDLITGVDDHAVANNDELIRFVSARRPGTAVRLRLERDGHDVSLIVKLAERPGRDDADDPGRPVRHVVPPRETTKPTDGEPALGLTVRELDRQLIARLELPTGTTGVVVARVEATSPAADSGLERGDLVLEINRERLASVADYRRLTRAARPGDILTLLIYNQDLDQRQIRTLRIDAP